MADPVGPSPVDLVPADSPFWKSRAWRRRVGQVSAGMWAASGLAFAGTVVAARALGPGNYGRVVLAVAIAGMVATFLDLTLEEAVVHFGSRALVEGDMTRLRSLLRIALFIDIAIGVTVSLGIVLASSVLANLAKAGTFDPDLIRLAALGPLAATMDGTSGAVLLLAGRPDLRGWMMAWTSLARVILVVVAVSFGGPVAVLIAYAVASAIGGITQIIVARRVGWRRWEAAPDTEGERVKWGRPLLKFGIQSSLTTSVTALRTALVPVVLGKSAGPAAVGVFQVAALPITASAVASGPVRTALLPEQARLAAEGNTSSLARSVRAYTKAALLIGIPGAVAGWFLLPWLVQTMYSERFVGAVDPARILLVAAVAYLAVGWGKTLPAAVGRPFIRTLISLLELVLIVGLVAAMASRGATGAAIAVAVASVVVAATWYAVAARVLLR